uniref:Uncharacterized protein n=1 Tax=Arundo donax TaxID=35708 RepID=A0A0A9EA12_ARUDO
MGIQDETDTSCDHLQLEYLYPVLYTCIFYPVLSPSSNKDTSIRPKYCYDRSGSPQNASGSNDLAAVSLYTPGIALPPVFSYGSFGFSVLT